jgi:hypothetical protein
VQYLAVDMRIRCDSAEYGELRVYAIVMLLLFAAGIPLFYLVVLWRHRHELYPRNKDAQVRLLANDVHT